jgi:hypothetical protein
MRLLGITKRKCIAEHGEANRKIHSPAVAVRRKRRERQSSSAERIGLGGKKCSDFASDALHSRLARAINIKALAKRWSNQDC